MPNYAALADKKASLLRKSLTGSVFIAPHSVAHLAALTSTSASSLVTLPTGWQDLGYITKDGVSIPREIETSEITSFGAQQPTRTDQKSDVSSITVTAQETKLLTMGLYIGIDTTDVEANATTGEVRIAKPTIAANFHYRVLFLSVDEIEEGEIYIARYFPYAKIVERGEETFTDGDEPNTYNFTFKGEVDPVVGTDLEYIFSGPGWKALLADMDIPLAS